MGKPNYEINLKLDFNRPKMLFMAISFGVIVFIAFSNWLIALGLYLIFGGAFSLLMWRDGNLVEEAQRLSIENKYLRDKSRKVVFGSELDNEMGIRRTTIWIVVSSAILSLIITWPRYIARWLY